MTLEEASEFVTDGTHGSPKRTEDVNGIPLLSAKNVFDGEVRWDDFDKVPESELAQFQKRVQLRQGDVLMTCVGTIGRAAVWMNERPVVFFRSVAIIRPKEFLLPEYLEYVIRSADFQQELRCRTKQSSQGGVYLKDIKAVPISVPPLPEQSRILNLLDEADELRKLRAQADNRTAQLLPALFHEMFGDPATNLYNWPTARLEEVATRITDGEHQTPKRTTSGIKLLSARNVRNGFLDFSDVDYIGDEEYRRINKRCNPECGDVLISCSGTIGRVAVVDTTEPFSLVRSVALVKPKREILTPTFLAAYLRTPFLVSKMTTSANASSQANLFQNQIKSLPVFIPDTKLQKEFAQRVKEIRELEAAQAASRHRTEDLFQSMLHKAFNGEL